MSIITPVNKIYNLVKDGFSKQTLKVIESPVISKVTTKTFQIDEIDGELLEILKNFKQTLEEDPEVCLNNFNNNIKSASIVHNSLLELINKLKYNEHGVRGTYDFIDNLISYKYLRKNTINHELLHLSSRLNIDGHTYVGIYEFSPACNEGYTALENARKFNNGVITEYKLLATIMKYMEEIVGSAILKEAYYTANEDLLRRELLKYCNGTEELTSLVLVELCEYFGNTMCYLLLELAFTFHPLSLHNAVLTNIKDILIKLYKNKYPNDQNKCNDFSSRIEEDLKQFMYSLIDKTQVQFIQAYEVIKEKIEEIITLKIR